MNNTLTYAELLYFNQTIADLFKNQPNKTTYKNFLTNLKQLVPFEKGEICFYRFENGNLSSFEHYVLSGWLAGELDEYNYSHIYEVDEILQLIANKKVFFRFSDVVLNQSSNYYQKVIKSLKLQHSIAGNIYYDSDGGIGSIALHRNLGSIDFSNKEMDILQLLRPHLMNVSRKILKNQVQEHDRTIQSLQLICDLMDKYYCLWDAGMDLEYTNITSMSKAYCPDYSQLISLFEQVLRNHSLDIELGKKTRTRVSATYKSYLVDFFGFYKEAEEKACYIAIVYDFLSIIRDILKDLQGKYKLSERELEVLQCIAQGLNNLQISQELSISTGTTKEHLENIYRKLKVSGRQEITSLIFCI